MATPHQARTPSNAHTPAPDAVEDSVKLPLPNTFDFVPPLHALLSRLLLPSPGIAPSAAHAGGLDGAGAGVAADGAMASTAGEDATALAGSGHLEIQQLGPASSAIKSKIQKARNAVKDLPDVDRTIEEQEEEIRFLQDRIARMRATLANVGKMQVDGGDVQMNDN